MKEIQENQFSKDIIELLSLLYKYEVQYLIVGGQAAIFYGHARLTGDIDIFFNQTENNVARLNECLKDFWNGNIPGSINVSDLMEKNVIIQFGVVPNRVDLISSLLAINFEEAWNRREIVKVKRIKGYFYTYYISLEFLIRNKEKLSREKDIEDLKFLKKMKKKKVRSEK